MFYHLLKITPRAWRMPLLRVLGDEPRNKGLGIEGLTTGDAIEYMGSKKDDGPEGQSMIAYRKIVLAILWPPKLLEVILTFINFGLDQLCLYSFQDAIQLKKQLKPLDKPGDFFRFLGRVIVFVTFGWALELVKYVASPYNMLIKPLYRQVEIGIEEWRKGTKLLLEAQAEQQDITGEQERGEKASGETTTLAKTNAMKQKNLEAHWLRFQGVWEITKTVLLVAAAVTTIVLMAMAIFWSGGAALPLFLLIKPAMASVATFLGGSAIAGSVVEALTLVVAFVASQIVMQKLLAIPAYLTDIWMGLTGRGGYTTKGQIINELSPAKTGGEETDKKNFSDHQVKNFYYVAFNDPLVLPEEQEVAKTRSETSATDAPPTSSATGESSIPPFTTSDEDSNNQMGSPSRVSNAVAASGIFGDDNDEALFGAKTKAPDTGRQRTNTSRVFEDDEGGVVSTTTPRTTTTVRTSFVPASSTKTTENPLLGSAGFVAKIGGGTSDLKRDAIDERDLSSTFASTTPGAPDVSLFTKN